MPRAFDACVKGKGRVRTISGPNKGAKLKVGQFRRICIPRGGGHPVLGHKETNKKEKVIRGMK